MMRDATMEPQAGTKNGAPVYGRVTEAFGSGPRVEIAGGTATGTDSEELQDLFDSVAAQFAREAPGAPAAAAGRAGGTSLFSRIGQLTRELHDTLCRLGYAPLLEQTARAIPDARARLAYVSEMTEQAARRVLNAIDIARPLQERLLGDVRALGARWEQLHEGRLSVEQFHALADDTRAFFAGAAAPAETTRAQLTEIMMAQEFQDLTGQVIKKLVVTVQGLENELLGLLVEFEPAGVREGFAQGLSNGPALDADGNAGVVANQQQVDDLLDSLGF